MQHPNACSMWSCVQPGPADHTVAGVLDRLTPKQGLKQTRTHICGIGGGPIVITRR